VNTYSAILAGVGLRSGRPASVALHARAGPFAFRVGARETILGQQVVVDGDRATVLRLGDSTLATVEHLLAACAAHGAYEGLVVEAHGGEVPLLDGGAAAFARALETLEISAVAAPLTVTRDAILMYGESRYELRRGPGRRVEVTLAFDHPSVTLHAVWAGSREDFVARIAPARTFALEHEVVGLIERGQAAHVDPESVVVLTPHGALHAGAPFTSDEPARHKLLDLIGDLFLYGGPPVGSVHAFRPGHRATHAILREAIERGVVAK